MSTIAIAVYNHITHLPFEISQFITQIKYLTREAVFRRLIQRQLFIPSAGRGVL